MPSIFWCLYLRIKQAKLEENDKMSHKIIIDCDPGTDDAMALLYAVASEEIEILAVHTVAGNVNVDHTTTPRG